MLNLPLPKGSDGGAFLAALREQALPFLLGAEAGEADDDAPTLLVVCAGFDGLAADPLSTMVLEPSDFGAAVRLIRDDFCFPPQRIALGLEGGYALDPGVGMPAAVVDTCRALVSGS